ncbi:MAG: transglycosylase SLT domain-containing protein [Dysgonamonadaceae bacterium]|jgi:membrane-bound lytic murein transglycosylase D|nr:transglycosylase SLT domain-containing protein [Dysgonamonadaceae bacterium]
MKKIIGLLSILLVYTFAQAQDNSLVDLETDTISFSVPEDWDANWDKLVNSWYVKHYTTKINHEGYQENTPADDTTYIARLSKLPNIIELPYNNIVRKCIEQYINRRSLVEYLLAIEPVYFPMIEETLDKYNLPLELKYLTIVESALNPTARSRRGASGLWQFMMTTGKSYGLEINSLIDERLDPVKSTDAACRHLKDLFDIYADWNLVIAAYNCGAGNVNKAIRRAKGKADFWKIYQFLPRETRTYVPLFIAANYMMNYYAYHQLYPAQMETPSAMDTVMINQRMHFDQISTILNIDKEELKALNPQYKKNIIPGNGKPYALKLPSNLAFAFVEKENDIANYNIEGLFTNRSTVENATEQAMKGRTSTKRGKQIAISNTSQYKVSAGESYYTISRKFPGYDPDDLMRLNNTRSSALKKGQYIRVPKI